MAKIIYEDNRIYIKSIIKKVEILPSEINKITSNEIDCIVTLYMKDSEVLQLEDSVLADTAYDYCLLNNISYENVTNEYIKASTDDIETFARDIKKLVTPIANKKIKELFGEDFDVELTEFDDETGKLLLLRLKQDGQLLEKHNNYFAWGGDIPNALDIIEISCKYKWDAEYGRDEYGIYPHEIAKQYWIDNMNETFSEIKRQFKL